MYYLAAYYFMNLGAFGFLLYFEGVTGSEKIDALKGMGYKAPLISVVMIVFLISLTGLPPTVGFYGKFLLFKEGIEAGLLWLVFVAALNSVVSLFYYMKIAKAMYFTAAQEGHDGNLKLAPVHVFVLTILTLPTLYLGVKWAPVKALADQAVDWFTTM